MSYFDTMSETDEMRAWEEGRLQGLKDIQMKLLVYQQKGRNVVDWFLQSLMDKMVEEQQDLLDEIYGDDDDE